MSDHGHHSDAHGHTPHITPLKIYFGVWGALMILTAATVAAAYVPFEWLHVPLALGIATVKATLVVLFFMHMLHDERFNAVLLLGGLVVVGIYFAFTMGDPFTRGDVNREDIEPVRIQYYRHGNMILSRDTLSTATTTTATGGASSLPPA